MNPWRRILAPLVLSLACGALWRTLAYTLAAREPLADVIVGHYWSGVLVLLVLGARLAFLVLLVPWLGARLAQAAAVHIASRRRRG